MATLSESVVSVQNYEPERRNSQWLKVGLLATASVIVGGLAAAWWYRETLKTLRQSSETTQNPQFGIQKGDPAE